MPQSMNRIRLTALGLGLLLACAAVVQGAITGTALDNGNGTFTYSYQVNNSGTFDIFAWSLELNLASSQIDWSQTETASGGGVKVPNADWIAQAGIPTLGGRSAQDFLALTSVITSGGSLSGFSFVSHFAPGTTTTVEFGVNGESTTGSTVGPTISAVPEPAATASVACLALAVFFLWHRKTTRRGLQHPKAA
jgi:hypothetical protein